MGHAVTEGIGFGERLVRAVEHCRTPLVVGIDPRLAELPPELLSKPGLEGVRTFARALVDVALEVGAPAVKPNSAFFEACGLGGLELLAELASSAREQGLLVILDAKRGDIGSTARAYARSYFGATACWRTDALTINPYLGRDTLEPFLAAAASDYGGLFVLVRTSNPGAAELQDASVVSGGCVRDVVARWVADANAATLTDNARYGCVGAVVGMSAHALAAQLRGQLQRAWLLVPGVGAQGGKASDLAPFLDDQGLGVVVPVSRGIANAWQGAKGPWQAALVRHAGQLARELAGVCGWR